MATHLRLDLTMRPNISLAATVFVLTSGMTAGAQMSTGPANLGFESRMPNGRPTGWFVNGQGFEVVVDSTQHFAGGASLRTRWVDSQPFTEGVGRFAVASQTVPLSVVAGR